MGFLFPDPGGDVPLARSPLREVICQIRFPPILRITESKPVDLQERIRRVLPQLMLQRSLAGTVEDLVQTGKLDAGPLIYRFQTPAGEDFATLSVDFLAVSTTRYRRWPQFAELLTMVTDAFRQVYEPADGTRVGLRYRNLITPQLVGRSTLSETATLLNDALRTSLLSDVLDDPVQTLCEVRARVDGDEHAKEFLTLRSGLAAVPEGETGYMLDFDYYVEGRIPLSELSERCTRYHDRIYRAFRWCLAPGALEAFCPQEVQE